MTAQPRNSIAPLSAKEAGDRFHALIMNDRMGLRFNKVDDSRVYHYTNLAGLRGILASEAVWASDYRYLNDRSEFLFGLEILEMLIAAPHDGPALPSEIRLEVLQEIALMRRSANSFYVLSASFCRKGNALSQWRAYGRDNGVAIGFEREFLEGIASKQGFTCGPVRYYFPRHAAADVKTTDVAWLQGRFDDLVNCLERIEVPSAEQMSTEGSEEFGFLRPIWRRRAIIRWSVVTAAFIKHPAFWEEYEWRCVRVCVDHGDKGWNEIKDRMSGTMVIPYVDLGIRSSDDERLGVSHVIVGPSYDYSGAMHSVSHVMDRCSGLGGFSIEAPFNPLRMQVG